MSVASVAGLLNGLSKTAISPNFDPVALVNNVATKVSNNVVLPYNGTQWIFFIQVLITGDNTTNVQNLNISIYNEIGGGYNLGTALYNQTMNTTQYVYTASYLGNDFNEGLNEFYIQATGTFTGTAPSVSSSIIATLFGS